jgi:hypothetical protein
VFDPGAGILDRFIILAILRRIGLFVPYLYLWPLG